MESNRDYPGLPVAAVDTARSRGTEEPGGGGVNRCDLRASLEGPGLVILREQLEATWQGFTARLGEEHLPHRIMVYITVLTAFFFNMSTSSAVLFFDMSVFDLLGRGRNIPDLARVTPTTADENNIPDGDVIK